MSPALHDLLADLASSERLDAPGAADRAWADGRGRRRRRRALESVAAGAAVLALLLALGPALVGAGALPGPSSAGSAGQAVDGHPERIGRQWWVRDLPDRPGPLAALLQTVEQRGTYDERDGWHAVAADGHRWRLASDASDDFAPALSPDGRLLGMLLADEGPYVVHDLVTGERTAHEDVSGQVGQARTTPHRIAAQHPSSWSPDGRWIAVQGDPEVLLLDVGAGTVRSLPRLGPLVGFAGPDRLAWFVDERPAPVGGVPGRRADGAARLVLTDLAGTPVHDVALRPRSGDLPFLGQSTGEVSPDGGVLAVTDEQQVRRFSTADGAELAAPVRVAVHDACGAAFGETAATLVVPTLTDGALAAERVGAASTSRQTVVADSVGGRCLVWAAAALDGPGRSGRGVTRPLLVVSAAALGALLVVRRRRR